MSTLTGNCFGCSLNCWIFTGNSLYSYSLNWQSFRNCNIKILLHLLKQMVPIFACLFLMFVGVWMSDGVCVCVWLGVVCVCVCVGNPEIQSQNESSYFKKFRISTFFPKVFQPDDLFTIVIVAVTMLINSKTDLTFSSC